MTWYLRSAPIARYACLGVAPDQGPAKWRPKATGWPAWGSHRRPTRIWKPRHTARVISSALSGGDARSTWASPTRPASQNRRRNHTAALGFGSFFGLRVAIAARISASDQKRSLHQQRYFQLAVIGSK